MSTLQEWYKKKDLIKEESSEIEEQSKKEDDGSVEEETIVIKAKLADDVELKDRASYLKLDLLMRKMNQVMMDMYKIDEPYTKDSEERLEGKKMLELLHKKIGELIPEL